MTKLIIPLTQHTSMIHFQPDQHGACLRASDLKPRIVKYYEKVYGKKPRRFEIKIALGEPSQIEEPHKNFDNYFGDIQHDGGANPKKLVYSNNIKLEINTFFNQDLRVALPPLISKVLVLENFGTRNNKGYGCFTTKVTTRDIFEKTLKDGLDKVPIYYWDTDYGTGLGKEINDLLEINYKIKIFCSLIKSGINCKWKDRNNLHLSEYKTYYKSFLNRYFDSEKNIKWDKREIKRKFKLDDGRKTIYADDEEYLFIRALLGTSEIQEWKAKYDKILKIEYPPEYQRIPSPLFFKVFCYKNGSAKKARIYFWYKNEISEKILNNKFIFKMDGMEFETTTPKEFLFQDFINWLKNKKYLSGLIINNDNGNSAKGIVQKVDKTVLFFKNTTIGKL
jgi:hypothetical protein